MSSNVCKPHPTLSHSTHNSSNSINEFGDATNLKMRKYCQWSKEQRASPMKNAARKVKSNSAFAQKIVFSSQQTSIDLNVRLRVNLNVEHLRHQLQKRMFLPLFEVLARSDQLTLSRNHLN